ncbi:MAG TPA: 5-(carboxyamino)imidazole ribonucleotide synthase [Phycisphaeraceae bacterium]
MSASPILPGATLGVLGGGQLGRMFAIAARRMGYRVYVLSPEDDTPTGQVADVEVRADYLDLDAVADFARRVSVVTFEFENVPAATAEAAARHAPVRPSGLVLHTTQNRLREKTFLRDAGLPVTPFAPLRTRADLEKAVNRLGLPAVLKTAAWGYDGKGQRVVRTMQEAEAAWAQLGGAEMILEAFIDFERELSVVGVRGLDGSIACFDPVANTHRGHILDLTVSPAGLSPQVADEAIQIARAVLDKLEVVGVLCVEFFLTQQGRLLVNELAPRPHNSGHLTIDAHVSCQFEQQVRAVCGLPLGSTRQLVPAAMANLLGDLWSQGEPDWPAACAMAGVKLHLYGKRQPRPGRKMGHLTALADTPEQAVALALEARNRLRKPS